MSSLDPIHTTLGDLCTEALIEAGVVGLGQTARAEDARKAWSRAQWLLQQWERKRWMVYSLQTAMFVSSGAPFYTVGPGGDLDFSGKVGAEGEPPSPGATSRIHKIESAFVRIFNQSGGGSSGPGIGGDFSPDFNPDFSVAKAGTAPVVVKTNSFDRPIKVLQSLEDYNRLALKSLQSLPRCLYYQPSFPLGVLFVYPVPNANLYGIGLTFRQQLPTSFAALATPISLPPEYYSALVYNLALALRSTYQIPSFQGDPLPMMASNALATIRAANTQIPRLNMPRELVGGGRYNLFTDQN